MIRKNIIRSILGTTLVLCLVAHPVKVLVYGFSELKNDPSRAAASTQSVSAAKVVVKSKNKQINLLFDTQKNVPIAGSSLFLQGKVRVRGKFYPASAAIIDNKLRITYVGAPTGSRKSRQRLYTLTSSTKKARLSSIPVSVAHGRHCSDHSKHENEVKTVMAINEGLPSTLSHIVTIHTYADQEWLAKYGSNSQEEIVNIINTAEAIYTSQLGIRFRLVGHNNYYTIETDSSKILQEFQKNKTTQNNEIDLKHLFTAKDVDGVVIGLAYIGVVCAYPDWAYGVTQDFYSFTPYVFAHEIGHNFGARHTTSGLMTPYIGGHSSNGFSDSSLSEINSHLNYFGSCLSLEETAPDLTKSKLSISFKNGTIRGRLLAESGKPIPNQILLLSINAKKPSKVKTDETGYYSRKIKTRGRYVVYVVTPNGEKNSRTIRFTIR